MPEQITFKPSERQNDFLRLPDSIFEALYGGAAGGGKTEILMMLPIIRKFYEHPTFKGLILRRTFGELEREIIRRSHAFYSFTGARYVSDGHTWKFPSGAFIDFGHAEHDDDIRKYDTAQYNYIAFDELTSFSYFQYIYLSASRCRSASPDLPAIVRSGTNPDGKEFYWVKKRFVEPEPHGYKILVDKLSNSKRIFIPAKLEDNPYANENDPQYKSRLLLLPERERAAKLYGSWDSTFGRAFEEFRRIPYSDEPENARHVIKPFDIPNSWPSICAGDWGWEAKTFALKGHLSPNGRVYITKEYSRRKTYLAVTATDIGQRFYGDSKYFFLDPSQWAHTGQEQTNAQLFHKYSGIVPIKADNDRISGKTLIHDYLRWQTVPLPDEVSKVYDHELAQKILRISGIEGYEKYLASFKDPEEENNLPKLQIFDTCTELIECIMQCMTDEKNVEDVAEFDGDDPYDTLRYFLKGIQYLILKTNPLDVKKQEVQSEFEEGKIEINSYYRRMEALEKKQANLIHRIRR